ncbi:MAG: lytic transglycosylase domain-containing protein [Candidatus Methylomirabilia bacterium]
MVHLTNVPTDPAYQRLDGHRTPIAPPQFRDTLGSRYISVIQEVSARHGVDARLIEAVIHVESGFDPWAISPKGAQGLMQLMPKTAVSLGVRDPFSPRDNIEGGVRLLRSLIDRYRGDLPLALAAYHAGVQSVDRSHGIPPYPETQEYVRRVLKLYNPGRLVLPLTYRYEDAAGTRTYTNIPPWGRR